MRRSGPRAVRAVAVALAAAALAPAAGPTAAAGATVVVPPGTERLSDERASTTWAYSVSQAPVRARPVLGGPRVGRLRLVTESGFAESYLVLARWTDAEDQEWLRIRLPGRPNGRTGWVTREALGTLRRTTVVIEVHRAARRLLVRRAGRVVLRARIGVGRRGTPTPAGRFWVRERYSRLRGGGIYGARALGTSAYAPYLTDWPRGGVVGIHGTDQPGLLPGAVSHGCIRLRNADVIRVHRLAGVGTPIWIR